jgi:hypothetical protein
MVAVGISVAFKFGSLSDKMELLKAKDVQKHWQILPL